MKMPKPLLVVVGETASGKTALAIQLARHFNGEIICADSRTLYRGMDIATAKPTPDERAAVNHHLIDVAEPHQPLNASEFKRLAIAAIDDIASRGKLPILVGGTGLYIDAVVYDYQFTEAADSGLRSNLEAKGVAELQGLLQARGLSLPENSQNKRHLIRAIETNGAVATRGGLRPNTLILGLQLDREVLKQRIADRIDKMFTGGLIEEAARLKARYPAGLEVLKTPGYKALWQFLDGTITKDQAKAEFARADSGLAKRQRTWFKRNKSIQWLANRDYFAEAVDLVTTLLNT
jgi:tRNA dimethylallyltransferase